jgi:hypothetical protein
LEGATFFLPTPLEQKFIFSNSSVTTGIVNVVAKFDVDICTGSSTASQKPVKKRKFPVLEGASSGEKLSLEPRLDIPRPAA